MTGRPVVHPGLDVWFNPTLLHIVCAILGERRRLRLAMFDVYEVGEAKSGYFVQLWISRHLLVRPAL